MGGPNDNAKRDILHGDLHRRSWSRKKGRELDEAAEQAKIVKRHIKYHFQGKQFGKDAKEFVRQAIIASPLAAALIAPLSTLYDIPGLTQHWYLLNGTPIPDPPANLALSAIGLAFNLVANALLIFRFSTRKRWWRTAMLSSTVCWVIKTIIALVNLAIFAANRRNGPQYSYSEGFWAAVFSAGIAGIISVILVTYAIYASMTTIEENKDIRIQGRHFLITELIFFLIIALEALMMYRLEGWSYFDAIFFSVVVATTIGYGNLVPTTTASRVLMFFFGVLTIAGLGALVTTIISYFSQRAEKRRARWRALYEQRQEQEYRKLHPTDELIAEMQFLERLVKQENAISRLYDLALSLLLFLLFWFLGAIVFHFLEGWTYGISLYFLWSSFLVIGFGDYYPTSAAGRVFWVLYAIIAVPIVASFAVQTISQIMTAFQENRLEKQKIKRGVEPRLSEKTTIVASGDHEVGVDEGEEISPFISHAELVVQEHERYKKELRKEKRDAGDDQEKQGRADRALQDEEDLQQQEGDSGEIPEDAERRGAARSGRDLDKYDTEETAVEGRQGSSGRTRRDKYDAVRREKQKHPFLDLRHPDIDYPDEGGDAQEEEADASAEDGDDGSEEILSREDSIRDRKRDDEPVAESSRSGARQQPDEIVEGSELYTAPVELIAQKDERGDRSREQEMLDEILLHALRLEDVARKLLISKFELGSRCRILLQADKNVMERAVNMYREAEADETARQNAAGSLPPHQVNELEDVHMYRETFARFLVAATRLKQLQGKEQLLFERRRGSPYRDGRPVEPFDWQSESSSSNEEQQGEKSH